MATGVHSVNAARSFHIAMTIRIGQGFDFHPLMEGRKLILGGVEIPYDRGLGGHSDADVAAHALANAILGALGEGDLGRHVPDSDPRYQGADSIKLLGEVWKLASDRGFKLGNADLTVFAQQPKLAPHLDQMRLNCNLARSMALTGGFSTSRPPVRKALARWAAAMGWRRRRSSSSSPKCFSPLARNQRCLTIWNSRVT